VTRGLRARDRALLGTALALFAACFALHLGQLARGGFTWMPVSVEAAPEAGFPRVRGFWWTQLEERDGLRVGDELLALEGESLASVGQLGLVARILARPRDEVAVTLRRGSEVRETGLAIPRVPFAWRTSLLALAFVSLGALAFWRARGFRPARLLFGALFSYGLHWTYFWGGSPAQTWAGLAAFGTGMAAAMVFGVRAALAFPLETASESRAARLASWAFVGLGVGGASWGFGLPFTPTTGERLSTVGTAVAAVALLAILTWNFRRAGPTGRRQLKWVLVGLYLGLAPPLLAAFAVLLEPRLGWLYEASLLAVLAIPLALLVALSRDHLYDVDRLISASATYSLLSLLAVVGALLAVPPAARLLAGAVDPDLAQVGLSALVAFALLGARGWLAPRVERLLFRERVALERGAQALRDALGASEKPSDLLDTLGARLDLLLAPNCTVIYAAAGEELAPVFVRGPAAAPGFGLERPLALQLAGEGGPLAVPARRRHPFWRTLAADEASALEAMGAVLLVPLRPKGALVGFVCLGEKRSGDVYTAQDRALLASIAEKASDELVRFHELELREAERALGARLRRYVPGAIAEELERGGSLAPGEREVTVLFVDVRGYASFAEPRSPAAIFEAVNAYTRVVSEAVREAEGTVVEFNGDGMMAVFGAPLALPGKERAALAAALAIRERVRALRFGDDGHGLDVGIGIATGPAYVGSIQGADRAIWSALGNTTNLAARLQALTREEAASIALDETTRRRAGEVATGFRSLGIVPIRGRRPQEVFTLPLASP
jgi:class 3 adenylate cyclase